MLLKSDGNLGRSKELKNKSNIYGECLNVFIELDVISQYIISIYDDWFVIKLDISTKIISEFMYKYKNYFGVDKLYNDHYISIDNYYYDGKDNISNFNVTKYSSDFDYILDSLDSLYPLFNIDKMINSYIDSDENILILSGSHGTDKTTLIKKIMQSYTKILN